MTTDVLFGYQSMELEDIQFFEHNFEKRLKRGDENLYTQLKVFGVETRTYLLGWVMTLFTRTMSLDMVSLLWDILFACNLCADILIEVAYYILQAVKKRLTNRLESEQLMPMLNNFKLSDIESYSVICSVR
jgi:hypothetical protein